MWGRISSASPRSKAHACRDLRVKGKGLGAVDSRQLGIPGYDPVKAADAVIGLVGAGGLCGEIGEGGVRKGWGTVEVYDGDDVEMSNLNRQLFTHRDLGKNKALCLSKRLATEGYMGTRIAAYPYFFQEALEKGVESGAGLLVCGVDNDPTRVFVARYCLDRGLPAVFTAVSRDAEQGYVFVQVPGGACFGCLFPRSVKNEVTPCPGVPAIKDVLKVVAGIVLYAVDTLIMDRRRNWNHRVIHLAGFMPDVVRVVPRNPQCPLCAGIAEGGDTGGLA